MHILHLITSINKGGAENHLFYLTKELKKKNKVSVIYFKGDNFWKKKYQKLGIKTINLSIFGSNFFSNLKKIFFIRDYIRKNEINIAHSHLPHMEILMFFVLLFNKKKNKIFYYQTC